MRGNRADGSTRQKINTAIRRGWRPGAGPVRDFLRKRTLRQAKGIEVPR